MIENRRVRFGNLAQVEMCEIELACDIWLTDLVKAPWVSNQAMKLAAHMVGYIRASNPANLQVREMETSLQLTRDEINRALGLMRLFGALTAFSVDKDDVRATLYLSPLQNFRRIELGARHPAMASEPRMAQQPTLPMAPALAHPLEAAAG